MTSQTASPYPLTANAALYNPALVEEFMHMLFRHVDWQPGQVMSILGVGEKGTDREGVFKERQIIAPAFPGAVHGHLKRWAGWNTAGFIVPAVLHPAAADKGDVTLDKVAALTAIILDLDSGDIGAKAKYVIDRLGKPSMIVASGGLTEDGKLKVHLYWLLNEPSDEIERLAALRKLLAAKSGGDQSFGRATQVIRLPGTVHAKNGKPTLCRILDRCDADYCIDDLADIIENMLPMPGVTLAQVPGPMLSVVGGMDFTPRQDTAIAALHRDVAAGGDDLTRWGEFSKVAGFKLSEARAGRLTVEAAYTDTVGWTIAHMVPPWPQARVETEFRALYDRDIATRGVFPSPTERQSYGQADNRLPREYFGDIKATLKNAWLVRNLLPLGGLALIYGSPGAGKSFLALDIALRTAAGWPVDGRAVKQSPVIYVAAEGQTGMRNRIAAFEKHYAVATRLPFVLVPCAVDLLDPKADLPRMVELINDEVTRLGEKPGVIVIDTLAVTFGGGDENSPVMVSYINNLAKLRDLHGTTVITVHHRPKDQLNDTPRGHSSLMGAMDTIIRVDQPDTRMATVTKQKDADEGEPICFNFFGVTLGLDEDGEPVIAAVVDYTKLPVSAVNRRPNGTHYRRAKGDHLAALRWVDAGRGLRAGAGAGRA